MLSIMYIGSAVAIAALNAFNTRYLHTLIHILAISTCTHIHVCICVLVGSAVAIAALNPFLTQYLYTHTHTRTYLCNIYIYTCIYICHVRRMCSHNYSTQCVRHSKSTRTHALNQYLHSHMHIFVQFLHIHMYTYLSCM